MHMLVDIIRLSHAGPQLLGAQMTIHLVQSQLPALTVAHPTTMPVCLLPHPVAGGQGLPHMIETILLPETELQMWVVMRPDHLHMTDHPGLRRPPDCLPMVVEVTTLEAVVIPGTIGHITVICHLHLRVVAEIASRLFRNRCGLWLINSYP